LFYRSEITIICLISWVDFRQKAKKPLAGPGAPIAAFRRLNDEGISSRKPRGVHGDLDDYSRTRFSVPMTSRNPFYPLPPRPFHQRASHHLGRSGFDLPPARGEFRVEQVLKRLGVGF